MGELSWHLRRSAMQEKDQKNIRTNLGFLLVSAVLSIRYLIYVLKNS
jgi:hypothetical protein